MDTGPVIGTIGPPKGVVDRYQLDAKKLEAVVRAYWDGYCAGRWRGFWVGITCALVADGIVHLVAYWSGR